MRLVLFASVCLLALSPGCRSNPKEQDDSAPKTKKTEKAPPKLKQARISLFTNNPPAVPINKPIVGNASGRVIRVEDRLRFIVIDFGASRMPALDQKLNVYRLDQKVAEAKISGPYRNTTVAADITAGEVKYGDYVKIE